MDVCHERGGPISPAPGTVQRPRTSVVAKCRRARVGASLRWPSPESSRTWRCAGAPMYRQQRRRSHSTSCSSRAACRSCCPSRSSSFRREFGSDLLAGISIVAAVLLQEYLAGVLVVLMLSGGEALEAFALGPSATGNLKWEPIRSRSKVKRLSSVDDRSPIQPRRLRRRRSRQLVDVYNVQGPGAAFPSLQRISRIERALSRLGMSRDSARSIREIHGCKLELEEVQRLALHVAVRQRVSGFACDQFGRHVE